MSNQQWSYLQPGDTVDVIAPGSGCKQSVVEKAKAFLESWDLKPHIPKNILGKDLLCANTDAIRFKQLKEALLNKKSKAIWCLRGGYGCMRLLPMLSKLPKPAHNKLFMGFSDITVLHNFLQQQWHWNTLHTPSLQQSALKTVSEDSVDRVGDIIFGDELIVNFNDLAPLNKSARQKVLLKSSVVGGNLASLQTSMGTHWQINAKNKILFLEDVNERAYRVDRLLQHLLQAGVFKGVTAVLFGDFTEGNDPDGKSRVDDVLKRFAQECDFPVLRCAGIGHGDVNHPLPLSTSAVLLTGNRASLSCMSGGKE